MEDAAIQKPEGNNLSPSGVVTIEAPPYKGSSGDTETPRLNLDAPSVRDVTQAWNLCKSTEQSNKLRSERATLMELQYTGQPPFSVSAKTQQQENWQSNVCTGILQGIVDQKVLQFTQAITGQVYLTRSSLPTTWPDWKKKSDIFDIHMTRLFQGWNEYGTFVPNAAKEDVLHGYGFAVFLDPQTWKPQFFKQDIAYVPDESPQHASKLQFFMIKQDYLLHDFIDLFKDESAAKEMGYDIDNCVKAAHDSEVKDPREDASVTNFRKFADLISDGVLGLTYASSGPRVVKTYLLWNREYDGKVSFWIIGRDNGEKLRFSSKIYKNFEDVVTLFSFQPGNGHLHSSKGLGRMLIGNVVAAEKMRNKGFDDTFLGSMLILKASSKDRNKLQPVVQAPFIVIDSSIDVSQQKFACNAEEYAKMDERITGYMTQSAGAYISPTVRQNGQPETATQVQKDAQREEESQDITEARWQNQFMGLVQVSQARACSDAHIDEALKFFDDIAGGVPETEDFYDDAVGDKDAIRTIVSMLKDSLTEDEIKMLRRAPAQGYAHTDDAITSRGILAVKQGYSGNPNIDQPELDRRSVEALAGPDAATALCIPTPDQTVVAEASRMQLSELVTMSTLQQPVPVSPRDNHLIHGSVVMEALKTVGPRVSQINATQDDFKKAELGLNHLGDHLGEYLKRGGLSQNQQYKILNDFYRTFKEQFMQAIQIHAHAAVAAEMPHPDIASTVVGQGTQKVPPQPIGSKAIPGAISGGAPMGEGVPDFGHDTQFESPGAAKVSQPAEL